MITRQITEIELHFDNSMQREDYKKIYENQGYEILEYGSADDWYFICQKENN